MASIYHYYEECEHTEALLVDSYKIQNELQAKVNWGATKIQSFLLGVYIRRKVEHERRAATVIQRCVRGWLQRYHLPDILQEYYDNLCFEFYNKAAAKIQAIWKGYMLRKYEVFLSDILNQRALVAKGNEEIQEMFKKPFSEFNKTEYQICEDYIRQIYKVLFDRHHLLSTKRRKGVLSKEGRDELMSLEKHLRVLNYEKFMNEIHKIYYESSGKEEVRKYKYSDKSLRKQEDQLQYMMKRARDLPLAPEKEKRSDIPFRLTTKIVREKLGKRVTTDGKFVPPIKNISREEDPSANVACEDFFLIYQKHPDWKPKRPAYIPNFWYEHCPCKHNEVL